MKRAIASLVFALLSTGCALDSSTLDLRMPNRQLTYDECVNVAYKVVEIWTNDALTENASCRGGPFDMDYEYHKYDVYLKNAENASCYQEAGKFYYDGDVKCLDASKTWSDVAKCDMASPLGKTAQGLILNYKKALDSVC